MPRKGHHHTKESKEKMSKTRKGRIPWNKGLTKETDIRVLKNSIATSKGLKGHKPSEKARKIASDRWLGDNNPSKNPELLEKRTQTRLKNNNNKWMPNDYIVWNKGLTKETNESVRLIGLKNSISLKGRKLPEFVKTKVSNSWTKQKKLIQSNKISEKWKDIDYRNMMTRARIGKYLSGDNHPMKKLCNRLKLPRQEKHWNWHGGISTRYSIDFTKFFKEQIRKDFGNVCMLCNNEEENGLLSIHHITYNKKENCKNFWYFVPLCRSCHMKTTYNRYFWFNLLINHWAMNSNINLNDFSLGGIIIYD